MKYSDHVAKWLVEQGYSHCFFVAGGNIMHLLESFSRTLQCVPVVHEVASGIAAEYFNAASSDGKRALALVTAGPGITNILTAMAGAYLESRELLVIGGQVKTADLSHGQVRQRGIQEIDGVSLARAISVSSCRLDAPIPKREFFELCSRSRTGRFGPVFIEMPLNVQAAVFEEYETTSLPAVVDFPTVTPPEMAQLEASFKRAKRPAVLLGGGVSGQSSALICKLAERLHFPLFTTWNGADLVDADHPCYFGRPNTWGQRYSNLLIQQADFILAAGTRLGLQQTGFNWQKFGVGAYVVQVDCDEAELTKGHPRVDLPICADANVVLTRLAATLQGEPWSDWLTYCAQVKNALPLIEANVTGPAYVSPHHFVDVLSSLARNTDVVIPCSSGGAFTIMMQVFRQRLGQRIVTNKGLASMGYGLSGAIGAAFANLDRRVILIEGDGGFSQNLQEIGTAAINKLNLKIFIFDDSGYASIRMTQRNYFGGKYVGCDRITGLGLPDWKKLFNAYDVPAVEVTPGFETDAKFTELFDAACTASFIVKVDPEQTYFPKIQSRVTPTGMESNPLHQMSPDLPEGLLQRIGKYLPRD